MCAWGEDILIEIIAQKVALGIPGDVRVPNPNEKIPKNSRFNKNTNHSGSTNKPNTKCN